MPPRLFSALLVLTAVLPGAPVESASVTEVRVYPPDVQLTTARDFQRLIAVATRDDGVTQEVTQQAEWTVPEGAAARFEGDRLVPVTNGEFELTVKFGDHTVAVPVTVAAAAELPAISFRQDVMPVFMRAGCNTGSCHGAARGKDGFRLSLFGYDPAGDYFRLTREIGARRINLAVAHESLVVEKATGKVPHTGGKRFAEDTPYYDVLSRWLQAGAPDDAAEVAGVDRVELFPPAAVLEGSDTPQQFVVRAHYSDGNSRDVTHLAVFLSNNDASVAIDADGLATSAARGEAFVTARYETHTVGSQVLVLPADLQYSPHEIAGNYIDQLVGAKLHKLRQLPSALCSDEEFLRRASIDIVGRLPTVEEHQAFTEDAAGDKRARWVDRLLEDKAFAEIWAMKWAELLMIRSTNQVSYKSAFLYNAWLADQIARDVPLDETVRNLLTATGGTFSNPPTNYYQIERNTLKTAENVAQTFMGIRTQCAQCHNHPFDRWTMDDYYSFAAFFAQVGRKQGEDYREQIIFNRGGGEVRHLVGNQVMAPKFLGGEVPDVRGKDRRQVLADWLTAADNPYFATSVANRVWAHFFGIGIVEPVDDLRVSNPPSNPQLLETLGRKLVEYKYDFKQLVRDICNARAYQRSSTPDPSNAHDERNFARAPVRRIPAEVLLDCVSQATDTQDKFRGLPLGARAVQIADGSTTNYFLTTFGRAQRRSACACEVRNDPTLSQALHLINGNSIQGKIRQGKLVTRWRDEGKNDAQIIETLYLRCLTRRPSDEERQQIALLVQQADNAAMALEDVFWAVLNSREFLFNH